MPLWRRLFKTKKTISELEDIINSIISPKSPLVPIINKNIWLEVFFRSQTQQKLEILEKEAAQLNDIHKCLKNQKSDILDFLLEHTKRIIIINQSKQIQNYLNQLLKSCKVELKQVKSTLMEMESNFYFIKDKLIKEDAQRQIKIYQQIIKENDLRNKILSKLNARDSRQLATKFTKQLIIQNKSWNDAQEIASTQAEKVSKLLTSNNLIQYIKQKGLYLKLVAYSIFYTLNGDIVKSLMVPIQFQQTTTKILLENKIKANYLYQCVVKVLKKDINEVLIELVYKDKVILIKNDDSIVGKPDKISVYRKIFTQLLFRGKFFKINISKNLSCGSLIIIVIEQLKEEKINLQKQNTSLFGMFGESQNLIEVNEQISHLQIKNNGVLKCIRVMRKIPVTIYYQAESYSYLLYSDKNVDDIKQLIYQKTKIPIRSQSLLYTSSDKQQEVISQTLEQIDPDSSSLTLTLISKMNLQHYGFHENYHLNFQDYTQFYIQKDNDMQSMIDSCTLKKDEEKNFFNQLIRLLYSTLKRRFPFTHITDQIKQMLFNKNGQQIWSGGDFSEYFLVYFILYNSDQKLRIQLMNILRTRIPLPLYYKSFKNINDIKEQWTINKEILWLMHPGLCITSIGLHTQNIENEKGKTYLNNLLFYSNFQLSGSKHPISHGCPQILLKALGSVVPVNIIDVPSSTPAQFINEILQITHVLIIHSWKGRALSQKQIKQIKDKYKIRHVICFLRDSINRQQTNVKLKNARLEENPFVQLHNLKQNINNNTSLPFLQILKKKIWMINNQVNFKDQRIYPNIFKLFDNKLFQEFNVMLLQLKIKFYDMKVVFNKYEHFKKLKNDRDSSNFIKQIQKIKSQTIKEKMASEFEKVLVFIDKNKNFSEILMLRLRQVLKEIKNQEQKKYNIITQYKKKVSLLPKDKKQQFQKLVNQIIRQVQALPKMKKIDRKTNPAEMVEQLSIKFDYYENNIKYVFFTIQSAWRQLQYLTTLGPQIKLGESLLIDFIIDNKRKEIANSQPFELLDGDLLEMPKNIILKVFEGITDRVAVISIMGPQSSGKSTLLNFLFGCDFGTSEGRCTKGVYGTYYKFSNILLPNCDGVFLMDTEGLFATLNTKDAARRKDFDSKLVLFCLAVSDFVIINTKGNLDSQSSSILKQSMERFKALTQENIQWPQIFLILNQNNSSTTMASDADINKMRQIFKGQNASALSQAYKLTELTKNDIAMLPLEENLIKKQPRPSFLTQTNKLQHSLISKIEAKPIIKPISVVINLMEKMWSTIEAYPDLGKTIYKLQKMMKEWQISKIQVLQSKKDQIFQKFKQNQINKVKCQQMFVQNIQSLMNEFKEKFLPEKQLQQMKSYEKVRIKLEESKIQLTFQAFKYELTSQIKDLQKDRLAEKQKAQGGEHQKETIRKVRKLQRDQNRELSKEEKEKYFQKAFQQSLERIRQVSAPAKQLQNYFDRTKSFYYNAANVTNANNAGLLQPKWKYEINLNYAQFSKKIKSLIFIEMKDQSNKYIEFKKSPPTKVLNESAKTDAKLEYFNMRDYFQKKKLPTFYEILPHNLAKCLKMDLLKMQMSSKFALKTTLEDPIRHIFQKLNKLFKLYGFKLESLQNFKKRFEYQMKFITWFTTQPNLEVRIQPQLFKKQIKQAELKLLDKAQLKQIDELIGRVTLQEKIQKIDAPSSHWYVYQHQTFLSNCLKEIIRWSNIKKLIQKSKEYESIKKNINSEIHQVLNKDLGQFGLSIQCSDYYQYIGNNNKSVSINFRKNGQFQSFEKQKDFFQSLKKFDKFEENKIRSNLKKTYAKNSSVYILQIGSYIQQTFEVLPRYRDTKQLQTYISNETNQVYYNLASDTMKQFVYNQIVKEKKTILKLFSNIDKIINKSPNYLTLNTVTSIYIDVMKEITEFNDDLNQVSQKFTLLFTGYVHLYAIYLTWKKFSEAALKQANKPYQSMLATRADKLNFFLKQTSNDENEKLEGESARFLNQVLAHFKEIIEENKQKINNNEAKKFKLNYPRKIIQQKIDRQCFDVASKEEDWMKYLTDPATVIQQKYESLTQESVSCLTNEYQNCQKVTQLLKQFKQVIKLLLQKLKSVNLTQDILHTDVFSIHRKTQKYITVADKEVLEVISVLVMSYFLDLLVGDQEKIYKDIDFDLEINEKYSYIKIIREPTPNLQTLISKLVGKKMSITRLYTFVEMVNKKLQQKEAINGVEVEKNSENIKKLMAATPDDKNKFRSLVTVKICQQLCPGCQRICGVEQIHTKEHECIYGHQMRALGNVMLNNGDASVIRCEDVQLTSQIQFNGKKMIWKQFKEYWQNKPEGSWKFDDLKMNINKQLFKRAWDITGKVFCEKNGMKFVEANAVELQKQQSVLQPTHYIFALDDSGSMKGQPWKDLMAAFTTAITTIKNISGSQTIIKISILVFNQTCRVFQENISPEGVNLQVTFKNGNGTNFADAFNEAYNLMTKYVADSRIKFIFMTDGQSSYPSAQVKQIKTLQDQHPTKIEYNGIEFKESGEIMKLISKELQGTNSISYNVTQLTSAYVEIIKRTSCSPNNSIC